MWIFPIQGLDLKKQDYIQVPVAGHAIIELNYKKEVIEDLFDKYKLTDNEFEESLFFVNKNFLGEVIDETLYKKIMDECPRVNTFVLGRNKWNKWSEIYYLKIAISIIYMSNRMTMEKLEYERELNYHLDKDMSSKNIYRAIKYLKKSNNFIKRSDLPYGFFYNHEIYSTIWDVKIGNTPLTRDDFELTVKSYCTIDDEPEVMRKTTYNYRGLIVKEDISDSIQTIFNVLKADNDISKKLYSVLNLLYSTLSHQNMDTVIITYATILETLLLENDEKKDQSKKVSVRSACLVANGESYSMKSYISTYVYRFYKYRNDIIHEGKSHIQLRLAEDIVFNKVVGLIQHLIYELIKTIISENITKVDEIKSIVSSNCSIDNITNAFQYISERINLIYQE